MKQETKFVSKEIAMIIKGIRLNFTEDELIELKNEIEKALGTPSREADVAPDIKKFFDEYQQPKAIPYPNPFVNPDTGMVWGST